MVPGLPLVSLPTNQLRARMAYSLYRTMNITDMLARDRDHYVELALSLGLVDP